MIMDENKSKKGNFTDLALWKKARIFRNEMYNLHKTFPKDERYRLSDQLIRASRSITANIAEGHGRYHFQENIQFCRIARGSLSECLDQLTCAFDCGFIEEEKFNKYKEQIDEINRILNGYVAFLKRQKGQ